MGILTGLRRILKIAETKAIPWVHLQITGYLETAFLFHVFYPLVFNILDALHDSSESIVIIIVLKVLN